MERQFLNIFDLHAVPVFAVDATGEVVYKNSEAERMLTRLGDVKPHLRAVLTVPPGAVISDGGYTFCATELEDVRVVSIIGEPAQNTDVLAQNISSSARQSLAGMGLSLDLMRPYIESIEDDRLSRYLMSVERSYFNLTRLVEHMSGHFNPEERGSVTEIEEFDLGAELRDLVDTVSYLAEDRGVEITFETSGDCVFRGDRRVAAQIVLNLMSNSLKYTPRGGKITVRLTKLGKDVVITVHDNGEGMTAPQRASAFRSYSEPRNLTDIKRGAGLGLATVSELAEIYRGSVIMDSAPGKGTTVTVRLRPIEGEIALSRPGRARRVDMRLILTELADVLESSAFAHRHMD